MQDSTIGIAYPKPYHKTVAEWRASGRVSSSCISSSPSWRAVAKRYARENGHAGVLRGDGSFILFYRDGESVRQRTWKHFRITR